MPSRFNCAPKFDQKVRIPSRAQIKDVFDRFSSEMIDQVYPVKDLITILGDFIAEKFSVNVLHSSAIEVDLGDINVAAYYDYEDDEFCKIAIELVLITNTQEKFILFNEELYNAFVKRIADALAHELIHMKQARARDFIPQDYPVRIPNSLDSEILYLSNPDEIDAYAHNIASELRELSDPLKRLSEPSSISIDESLNLWVYLTSFDYDLDDPVLRKLLKKVYKNLK